MLNPNLKAFRTKHQVTGWLEKQKKKGLFGRKWQKRWFELEAHYLVYKTKETGEILAAIDMRGVDSVVIEPLKDKRKDKDSGTDANQVAASTTFCLNLGGIVPRKYLLRADSVDTMREWVDAINERLSTYNRLFGKQEIGGTDEPGARQAGRRNLRQQPPHWTREPLKRARNRCSAH